MSYSIPAHFQTAWVCSKSCWLTRKLHSQTSWGNLWEDFALRMAESQQSHCWEASLVRNATVGWRLSDRRFVVSYDIRYFAVHQPRWLWCTMIPDGSFFSTIASSKIVRNRSFTVDGTAVLSIPWTSQMHLFCTLVPIPMTIQSHHLKNNLVGFAEGVRFKFAGGRAVA